MIRVMVKLGLGVGVRVRVGLEHTESIPLEPFSERAEAGVREVGADLADL